MSLNNGYKRAEKKFIKSLLNRISKFSTGLRTRFTNLKKSSKQKYTVMLIPHTEKKAINFKISYLSILFLSSLMVALLFSTILLGTIFVVQNQNNSSDEKTLTSVELENMQLRDSVLKVKKASQDYKTALYDALGSVGLGNSDDTQDYLGDYSSFFSVKQQDGESFKEVSDLDNITSFFSESTDDVSKLSEFLEAQGSLAKEIPTLWPLSRGVGRITNTFGPNIHPFQGYWYLHKGVDIAYMRGTSIIATANGKVVQVERTRSYGLNLTIKHSYGFYTRYAHCDNIYVKEGQVVSQGQQIAALGNTGMSTGPHVHYEVRIGSQNIDPMKFLEMKNN